MHDTSLNVFKEQQANISSQLDACEQAFIAPRSESSPFSQQPGPDDFNLQNTSFFAADLKMPDDASKEITLSQMERLLKLNERSPPVRDLLSYVDSQDGLQDV